MTENRACTPIEAQFSRVFDLQPAPPSDHLVRLVLEHAITSAFAISSDEFWGLTRGQAQAAFARQVGMYLAHVVFSLSLTEVGHLFARDRTTVAHACMIVEDRRDDRCFDRSLELLESAVRLLRPPAHVGMGAAMPQLGPLPA